MVPPSRRRVLETASTTAAALLSGCVFGEERATTGHLFLENRTEEVHRIALSVSPVGDGGDRPIHAVYRVPSKTALRFEGVLENGRTYDVRALMQDVPDVARPFLNTRVETCGGNGSDGRLDVSVLAGPNGPDVITYGCDEQYSESDELTYQEDPSEFRVGSIDGTLSSPTPTSS